MLIIITNDCVEKRTKYLLKQITGYIWIYFFGPADHPHKLGHPASEDPRSRVTSTLDNDIYSFTLCFYCGG